MVVSAAGDVSVNSSLKIGSDILKSFNYEPLCGMPRLDEVRKLKNKVNWF